MSSSSSSDDDLYMASHHLDMALTFLRQAVAGVTSSDARRAIAQIDYEWVCDLGILAEIKCGDYDRRSAEYK